MLHSSDRWKRIEALFLESLELEPESRSAFLDENCGSDLELKKEVQSLLNSAGKPMDFLEQPVLETARDLVGQTPASAIASGTQVNQYEIISLLGVGGMGQVYLAQDTRLKRKVALKMLCQALVHDERGLRRLAQEARAASALNHPNILTIYEFGEIDGLHFIAAEFVDGATLRQKLSNGRLDLNTTLDISAQIAGALNAAHSSGIIHRDIKPENVIIRRDGLVKVVDFGIAKLAEAWTTQTLPPQAPPLSVSISQRGLVIGSARYMSPEQARGQAVDPRSDIFSLGIVIYEMAAGRVPFEGQTVSDVIADILKSDPLPLTDVAPDSPSELGKIVSKAMCKDREGRYQSVNHLLADLQEFKREAEFREKFPGSRQPERSVVGEGGPPARPPERVPVGENAASGSQRMPVSQRAASYLASITARGWGAMLALLVVVLLGAGYGGFLARKGNPPNIPAATRSLAILPFRNLKQDTETDFLSFSLADAIITKLGYVSALTVRPSSSVDKYRNQSVDPQRVAADLSVDTVLMGSFIKDGGDLRITAQLIDVKPNRILWRDSFDVKYDKLLTVQDRVSEQIIKGLEVNLSSSEAEHLKSESPINAQAYEYYLRGVDLYSSNDFSGALGMLEKSTAIDPKYAPAWAYLVRAYTTNASLHFGGREQYDKAESAYEKAIVLNPVSIEPRIYMANMLTDTGRVEQAVPLLRTALQSSPNNAELHWELGYAYRFGGMLRESVAECERARQNNQEVKINSSALNGYLYLGEYDKFMKTLPASDSAYVLFYRGFAEYYSNRREPAARDFDRAFTIDPGLLPAIVGKALSYSMAGRNTAGLALLRQTENRIEERGVRDAELIYKVAQAYAVLGDKAKSLHMLGHTIEGGFFCYPYFMSDPLLGGIRNEPEFQRLIEEARQRHEQFKARFF